MNQTAQQAALLFTGSTYQDPFPVYEKVRREAPVLWCPQYGSWIVTGYREVRRLLASPDFSSRPPGLDTPPPAQPGSSAEKQRYLQHFFGRTVSSMDPPEHRELRHQLNHGFNHHAIRRLRPLIAAITHELLDRLSGSHEADIIHDFAFPLPALVVARLLGVPDADLGQIKEWANNLVTYRVRAGYDAQAANALYDTVVAMTTYLDEIITLRRQKPQSDFISTCLHHGLTPQVLSSTCVTLLVAGHETTTNLIGNGLLALLKSPDQLAQIKEDTGLTAPAIEEFLRLDSPVQLTGRVAKRSVVVAGHHIRRGQFVTFFLGAANRDPAQFPQPDRLRIDRHPNPHLAFGYGPHFCLGGALARAEGQIAFTALLHRLQNLELATDSPSWADHVGFRGLRHLPVSFTAVLPPAHNE